MGFVKKVDHINVVTTDLDASIELWGALTGFQAHPAADHASLGYRSADIVLPDGNNLSLMTPLDNDMGAVIKRFIETKSQGLYIISLAVDSPEAVADDLAKQDLRMIPLQGMAFVHPKSSNGVSVEYIRPGVTDAPKSSPAPNAGSFRAVGVNHIGIAVNDLADATTRWGKILGGITPQSTGDHPDLGYKGAFAKLPNGGIDLIEPLVKDESNNTQRMINQKGEGMILLALDMENVSACATELNAKGWRVNDFGGGVAFVSPKNTRGVMLELIEKK